MSETTIQQILTQQIQNHRHENSIDSINAICATLNQLYYEKESLYFGMELKEFPKDLDLEHLKAGQNIDLGGTRLAFAELGKDDDKAYVAFTSEETLQTANEKSGHPVSSISFSLFEVWLRIKDRDEIKGICIDPWSNELFVPKEMLQACISGSWPEKSSIRIVSEDITQLQVDAIVNAANKTLLGGGGVDGAIHKAAGPALKKECKALGGCKTGEAKVTFGYNLPALYVIHTVGPIYASDSKPERHLANCYTNSLNAAMEHDVHSIAFPAISTGAYGYPHEEAAAVAIATVGEWLDNHPEYPITIVFCCFDQETLDAYQQYLSDE